MTLEGKRVIVRVIPEDDPYGEIDCADGVLQDPGNDDGMLYALVDVNAAKRVTLEVRLVVDEEKAAS